MARNYREIARVAWHTDDTSAETISAAMLQRIAEGIEHLGKSRDALESELARTRDARDSWRRAAERHERTIRALRGHLTRLQRQLATLTPTEDGR